MFKTETKMSFDGVMKLFGFILAISAFGYSASAETWRLNDLVKKGEASGPKDMSSYLMDLSLEPAKDAQGKDIFKIVKVASGSTSEKIGVKPGDFLVVENTGSGHKMELKQTLKKATTATQNK